MNTRIEDESTGLLDEGDLHQGAWHDDPGEDSCKGAIFPQTYVVLKFSKKASAECIEWLAKKIQGPRYEGGAELLVRRQPSNRDAGDPIILHVSASWPKLLEVAEEMEIRVKDLSGREKEFMVADIEDYIPLEHREVHGKSLCLIWSISVVIAGFFIYSKIGEHPMFPCTLICRKICGAIEELFPLSERQRIVHRQLHITMRTLPSEHLVPGYPNMQLIPGESMVHGLLREGILVSQYILHDEEFLKKLGPKWYRTIFGKQPLDEIHTYFGEAVTLYFTFLGFYTKALIIPMLLGLLQILFTTTVSPVFFLPFFCLFNMLWVTSFLELWKQKCSELAFAWGTIGMTSLDEPRPGFWGKMKEDPITRRLLPQYPRWKTNVKMYCVSIPIVLMCLVVAFYIMLLSFWIEDYLCETHWMGLLPPLDESEKENASIFIIAIYLGLPHLPTSIYTTLIYLMNWGYRRFATALTEWENHRTQSQFDRHRVTKLILFEFVNNFMALFYIAFYLRNMAMLKYQLGMMLIFLQVLNNIQEAVLPICLLKVTSSLKNKTKRDSELTASKSSSSLLTGDHGANEGLIKRKSYRSEAKSYDSGDDQFLSSIPCLDPNDPRIQQAISEGKKVPYEGTYDDYLELFMQFGYVFLFASVYPAAAFLAVLNNVVEIRIDAFKLCQVLQKPLAERVKDIGAWQRAFEAMGSISVMTNCALLGISMWKTYSYDAVSQFVGVDEASNGEESLGPMGMNLVQWALVVVAVEHLLLLIQCLLHYGIPDRPQHVRVALARQAYCSKQALKQQKSLQSQKKLRRLKTITVPDHHVSSAKWPAQSIAEARNLVFADD